ncbi:hypothetical protein Q1695_007886 [Nippostrongylus brasiliensis]|nr:hypothetical protein Q1695_007886 [Nippostrongylus brasiliensis]
MTTNVIFLSMDIAILLFQTVGFACNGVILFMFLKVKELRRRPSLRIALFLTVSHFVYDLISLPCIIYMTCSWKTERIDMDPYVFLFISVPMPVLLKINLTLTVAVAFERALANLTTLGILVSSFVFLTIPSIAVGVVNMFGFSVFDSIGPFYTLCLVCTGICNCVVYIAMNKELLTVAKRVLRGMDAYSNTEHTIFRMSTAVSS